MPEEADYRTPLPMTELSFPETRVLGCLIEKELTTPDNYPLTLNSLVNACNQTTNREPVTAIDDATVQAAADALRQKQFATAVFSAGSRVQKYRHELPEHYTLTRAETALLATLLLRGPQTPGELRQRSERMAGALLALPEVEELLTGMAAGSAPLVRAFPPAPGRKEKRYVHLLSGEPAELPGSAAVPLVAVPLPAALSPEVEETLRAEIAALREELIALREEFHAFKAQF